LSDIGELFVSLGIKGGDKTLDTLAQAKDGMGKVRDISFEAKAAIAAAAYALEKMFAAGGQHGLHLESLSAVLDTSTTALQQYEYAAKLAGIGNEELAGTFMNLSKTSAQVLRGEARPLGLNSIMDALRKAGHPLEFTGPGNSLQMAAGHPEILLRALQEYAKIEKDVGLRNLNLASFGISDPNMIRALVEGRFNEKTFAQAHLLGGGEVKALDKNREHMANIGDTLAVGFEHLEAKFGPQMLDQIDHLVTKVMKLADAFGVLVTKTNAISAIGQIFVGWGFIFDEIGETVDKLNQWSSSSAPTEEIPKLTPESQELGFREEDREAADDMKAGWKAFSTWWQALASDVQKNMKPKTTPEQEKQTDERAAAFQKWLQSGPTGHRVDIHAVTKPGIAPHLTSPAPRVNVTIPPQASNTPPVEVNQTLNFGNGAQDSKQVASDVKVAVRQAFRQLPSIGQMA
jgi:hypothetical protein